ncbi:hypothetical protein BH11MYX4_BH11MYX4_23130 [soil metagenome]
MIYNEGLRLHDQHKEAEALEKFQKAFGVYPSPNILFNVARQEQLLDKSLLALRHYREAMKSALLHPTNATLGKQYIAELEARLGRVELVGPAGLKVSVANAPEITLPVTEPIDVEPGTVVATGKLGEARYDGSLVAQAGRVNRLELKTSTSSAPARATDPAVEPPPVSPSTTWGTGQYVGVAMWAGAAIAAGVGVGFTLAANSASEKVVTARAASPDADWACGGSASADCMTRRDAYDSRVRDTNIAVGSFIGAGALLLGGTLAFFAWPSASSSGNNRGSRGPIIVPIFGKQERGLELRQEF